MLHLEPHDIQIVQAVLKKYSPHQIVIAFGSRVTDQFKPHSDLDICVMGRQPLPLEKLAALREAFSESDLPMRVDIVDWASISAEFKMLIKANFVKI